MEEFQVAWMKVSESMQQNGSDKASSADNEKQSQSDEEEQEPATVKAAEPVSENVFGHHLAKDEEARRRCGALRDRRRFWSSLWRGG